MRTETVSVRIGENVGPVDWSHPMAADMPAIWRLAELDPGGFLFSEHRWVILAICMYDGWPYWTPTPAIQYIGPLKRGEWAFFDSYGVSPDSISPAVSPASPDAGAHSSRAVETGAGLGDGL